MADISMCMGESLDGKKVCRNKDRCYRYTAIANEFRQSYSDFASNIPEGGSECEHFWDNGDYKITRSSSKKKGK